MLAFFELENNEKIVRALSLLIDIARILEKNEKHINGVQNVHDKLKKILMRPGVARAKESEIYLWQKDKIKIFISHRDKDKKEASLLAKRLEDIGISSFVAHETIQPTKKWKDEIHSALLTMDCLIAYITKDFYTSPWTNQELGFAFSQGVPVYLYSVDTTAPQGFHFDEQTFKHGEEAFIQELKKIFVERKEFKAAVLNSFIRAVDGSFDLAKSKFLEISQLSWTDSEIDQIVAAITGPAKTRINQLGILLIRSERMPSGQKNLTGHDFYWQALEAILKKHSRSKYQLVEDSKSSSMLIKTADS